MSDTTTAPDVYVKMRAASGQGEDTQWFDYRPGYFSPVVRIEWDKGTMYAALPPGAAGYLIKHGHAKALTEAELEAYTGAATKLPEEPVLPPVVVLTPPAAEPDPPVVVEKADDPPIRRKKEKTS